MVSDFILSLLASCAKQRPNGAIKKVGLALYSRPRVNHASRPKKITMRIFFLFLTWYSTNWLKCFMKEHSYFCIAHQAVDIFSSSCFLRWPQKLTKSSPLIWCLLSKCQIDDEDIVNFCGLLRKHELWFINQIIYVENVWFLLIFDL